MTTSAGPHRDTMFGQPLQKHRNITLERLDKFVSTAYFTDVNLLSKLFVKKSQDAVKLKAFQVPDLKKIPFAEAIKGEYKPVEVGQEFGPSWTTVWFHVSITVPQDFANQPIELHFDNNAEGLVYTTQGEPLVGLTGGTGNDRHIDFPFTESAKAGDKFEFYIEMACNGMFGCGEGINPPPPDRKYKLTTAEIAIPNRPVTKLLYDFQVIAGLAKELPADSQRGCDALFYANKICNTFLPDDPSTWEKCSKIAREFFETTSNGDNPQHEVTAIGHCHIDSAWLWNVAVTKGKCGRSWSSQCTLMDKYPDFKFACSQAVQYEWVKELYPSLYERIKDKVKTGQFIPIGGTWVEMDCNIPSGESFCRQFLFGQRFFEREFGSRHKVFWLPDTFGYSPQLPQIIRESDIDYFFTQKLSWNNINKFPHTTFYWAGLDDSRVLTHFSPADTYCANGTVKEMLFCVTNHKDKTYSNKSLFVAGFGDGGGGPTAPIIERIERMNNVAGLPRVKFEDPTTFFDQISADTEKRMVNTWKGELYFELHRGTYTSQAKTKWYNRVCELLLRDVEILAALGHVSGQKAITYPQSELEEMWKLVLLNQFHDILPGSSIELVYVDAIQDYEQVYEQGTRLRNELVSKLVGGDENAKSLAVVNTTSYERRDVLVEVDSTTAGLVGSNVKNVQLTDNGKKALVVVDSVPAMASKTVHVNTNQVVPPISVEPLADGSVKVENKLVSVVFNAHGQIVEFIDKRVSGGRAVHLQEQKGNVFVMYEDIPLFWDAWDIEAYHLEKGWHANVGKISIVESGPLRVSLRVTHPITPTSTVTQTIIMDALNPTIEFDTTVDWNENRKCLKVEFPVNISNDTATYETQFGIVTRPTHYNTSWDVAKFEVCGHRFVDYSEYGYGVALLNDCKYGMVVHDHTIRLTLLRAPKAPDAHCDLGKHHFRYALYPHSGTFSEADVVAKGIHFNSPLLLSPGVVSSTEQGHKQEQSYFEVNVKNVVLDTIKRPEPDLKTGQPAPDNELLMRLYEGYGGRGPVELRSKRFKILRAAVCNVLEEEKKGMESAVCVSEDGMVVRVKDLTPFKVLTLRLTLEKN